MAKKIGVYVCECGTNIADKVNIDKVLAAISPVKDVEVAERYKLLCSGDGQKYLKQSIEEHGLTHVVVAACSPKQHETTFMNVCEQAGLNPYLFQLVNIREQCAWVTSDGEDATNKAIRQIRAAISRVQYHAPLGRKEVECSPDILVIGGGIAGIKASQLLATPERKVYLIEKTSSLGGKVKSFSKLFTNMESGLTLVEQELDSLQKNENIPLLHFQWAPQYFRFSGGCLVPVLLVSGKEIAVNYKSDEGKEDTLTVDMVILNPALEPQADSSELAKILNVPQGKDGFFSEKEPDLTSVATAQDGIFIAGCAQSPKDITETVAEAEATAGRVLSLLR